MSLSSGARLGPYEITASLGAGGMGEVYRARDARLNRDVAIKVLPAAFTDDRERLARFEREAQLLAQLHHPNIASVFGLEESPSTSSRQAGVRALVMELVDGEDLSARIARGPIPLDEALPIAKQIAEALEAAHGHVIIHRDLKPANVKITHDGTVKVLDFGLAKDLTTAADPAVSPTFTAAATALGTIVGTAAYMAPEQARGRAVDRRADVWAFGCVLYEMIVGRPAFAGETATDIIASVVQREPDWTKLPANTPDPVRRLLRRCLQKDPKLRLRDIGDARLELIEPAHVVSTSPAHRPVSNWRLWAGAALAAIVVTAAAFAAGWRLAPQSTPIVTRTSIALPEGHRVTFRTPDHP